MAKNSKNFDIVQLFKDLIRRFQPAESAPEKLYLYRRKPYGKPNRERGAIFEVVEIDASERQLGLWTGIRRTRQMIKEEERKREKTRSKPPAP